MSHSPHNSSQCGCLVKYYESEFEHQQTYKKKNVWTGITKITNKITNVNKTPPQERCSSQHRDKCLQQQQTES